MVMKMLKKRFMAYILDLMIVLVMTLILIRIYNLFFIDNIYLLLVIFSFFFIIIYSFYHVLTLGFMAQTIGEKVVKIIIVNESKELLSFKQALIRVYLSIIFCFLYPVSLYFLYISNNHQNLIDKIMKTKVIQI